MALRIPEQTILPGAQAWRNAPGGNGLHTATLAEQLVAFGPADHEAQRKGERQGHPATSSIAAIPDVQDTTAPRLGADVQDLPLLTVLITGARSARRPPAHVRDTGWAAGAAEPHQQQANLAPARHKQRPRRRMREPRLETGQTVRFTGAHGAQIGGGQTLWFLQDAGVPDQQRCFLARFQHRKSLRRLSPEIPTQPCGLPLGRAQQVGEAFRARWGMRGIADGGAQLAEQQPMRTVTPFRLRHSSSAIMLATSVRTRRLSNSVANHSTSGARTAARETAPVPRPTHARPPARLAVLWRIPHHP